MFYVYVLKSQKDRKYYTGYTKSIRERFKKHNTGGVTSTKHRVNLELVYLEGSLNEFDSIRREKFLKSGRGKVFLKKRLKYWYKESSEK